MDPSEPWLLPFLRFERKTPGLIVGDKSVKTLSAFIGAYTMARNHLGAPEYGEGEETLLAEFAHWLAPRVKKEIGTYYSPSVGWSVLVGMVDPSPTSNATFFRFFDEFLAEKGIVLERDHAVSPWARGSKTKARRTKKKK